MRTLFSTFETQGDASKIIYVHVIADLTYVSSGLERKHVAVTQNAANFGSAIEVARRVEDQSGPRVSPV